MMEAGARMMKGSTEGTFATIGEGLETGLEAYGEAKTARQLEEDRGFTAEERARDAEDRAAQKEVNDKIREITGGWDETTTPEQKISDYQRAANVAFASGDSPLGRGLIEAARLTIADPEAGPSTNFTNYDQTVYRAPDGTRTRGRKRTVGTEQTFEYFDKSLFEENVGEGMSASEAQRNSWRAGGYIADPEEEEATADAAQQLGQQERMNSRLGGAAKDANWSLVIDTETGAPIYLDYQMAGAVPIAWDDDGNPTDWRAGELDDLRLWQSFFGEVISNAGSETVGAGKKLFNMIVRTQLPSGILEGYTEALNYINPTVRFLSGAQMTNQEAMRYYNALLPMSGDSIENIERKRRKRDVLTNAMGGSGITEAQKLEARELLGIGPDEEMGHLFSDFGELDPSGTMAMDYYLARLTEKLGSSNTFTREQMRQMGALRGGAGGSLGSDLTIGGTP
jgi:hypothetical protein